MQIRISEMMEDECPAEVSIGCEDREMARRIRASVMQKIGAAQPKSKRLTKRSVKTLLLAAVLAALLGTAAYAGGAYFMNMRKTEESVSGYWRAVDSTGRLTDEQKVVFPDAGMVLSFEGPSAQTNRPEFRCWYLPSEATFGFTDREGWTSYLSDNGVGASIPYIVSASNVRTGGFLKVINGDVSIVKEEDWDDWHVAMLTSDYTNCKLHWTYERANFILLFNKEQGWLIAVCGTADMETLEHIARELEIRDSGEPAYDGENQFVEGIGMIDPGRG